MTSDAYSDAAKRCSGAINIHVLSGNAGRYVAIRLSDGGSDGVVYDTWNDAVDHQLHETQCCYIKIPPDGMTPLQAERFLDIHRQLYDGGFRMVDPEAFKATMPNRLEAYFNGDVAGYRGTAHTRMDYRGTGRRDTAYSRWVRRHGKRR